MDRAGSNEREMADRKEGERLFSHCNWSLLAKILESGEQRAELRSSPPSQTLPSPCYGSICSSLTEEEVFFHPQLSSLVCRVISWRARI